MKFLELRIRPPVVVLIFAAAMVAVARTVPAPAVLPLRRLLAAMLVLAGVLIGIIAITTFRNHRTTINPATPGNSSSLVTSGIYSRTRNPMYLGLLLGLAGVAVYLANWVSALLLPLFVLYMNRFQIGVEERVLAGRFGNEYLFYCSSTRRWF